jgi:hypothetical protein
MEKITKISHGCAVFTFRLSDAARAHHGCAVFYFRLSGMLLEHLMSPLTRLEGLQPNPGDGTADAIMSEYES